MRRTAERVQGFTWWVSGLRPLTVRTPFADLVFEMAVVTLAWLVTVTGASVIVVESPASRHIALFGHLISLIVGFGAVVAVDAYGFLWLLGRRTAAEIVRFAATAHVLISAGVVGLLVSGAILQPDLTAPLPRAKSLLVLMVMLNGVNAHRLSVRLRALPGEVSGDHIPWWCIPRSFLTAVISQVGWWGAIIIGFLTTTTRARG
jgi:hypothetical protein